jgi:mRNA-degrading endonuclease RelE of RelBE toxin-antitoxin system
MAYTISYSREALADLKSLPRADARRMRQQIEQFLLHQPTQVSRARIKRLRGTTSPEYRLRVDPYRVLYDVDADAAEVLVLRIGRKPDIYTTLGLEEAAAKGGEDETDA